MLKEEEENKSERKEIYLELKEKGKDRDSSETSILWEKRREERGEGGKRKRTILEIEMIL
jgi:hypothetical protein